jgi:hypothetical protein
MQAAESLMKVLHNELPVRFIFHLSVSFQPYKAGAVIEQYFSFMDGHSLK